MWYVLPAISGRWAVEGGYQERECVAATAVLCCAHGGLHFVGRSRRGCAAKKLFSPGGPHHSPLFLAENTHQLFCCT